jgi:hypothetical protein
MLSFGNNSSHENATKLCQTQLNTLSRISRLVLNKCFCITSMHDMLGAIGLIQMRAKRTKPHFHQPQVFNRSKQRCDRRTLSRAICWYVLMLPEHLSVRWHAHEQLAATGTTAK